MTQAASPIIQAPPDYRGRTLCYYHPNGRGTGSAVRFEPRLNRNGNDRYNCFFVEWARQKDRTSTTSPDAFARFDWEGKITVKLGFLDLCELLTVLEGRATAVGANGKGLYHATEQGNTLITFAHQAERKNYLFAVSRKLNGDAEPQRISIALSKIEATGLRHVLQMGLFFVTFPGLLQGSQ